MTGREGLPRLQQLMQRITVSKASSQAARCAEMRRCHQAQQNAAEPTPVCPAPDAPAHRAATLGACCSPCSRWRAAHRAATPPARPPRGSR